MHQANGDTRLCTACIDHVDLVAVGRAVLRETGRKDLKLGGKRRGGSPPLPPRALHRLSSSSGHGCTLAESTDVRTERDREERERERERESGTGLRDPCSREYVARIQATTRFPVYTWPVRVRACVFSTRFITELLMPRGEGAAVSSHPSTLIPRPSRPTSPNVVAFHVIVLVVVSRGLSRSCTRP